MKIHTPLKIVFIALGLMLVAAVVLLTAKYPKLANAPTENSVSGNDEIVIITPAQGQEISSPVHIEGKAKGNWFFEASFPITVLDENGNTLGISHAQAQGDWQTSDFVNFIADITFNPSSGTKGILRFENDNPSGLPENQKTFDLPITFTSAVSQNPSGTCSPNLIACAGDPKKCMNENVNAVCN